MSKAIAQKSPLGILGVTQNKAPGRPDRKLTGPSKRKTMGGRPYMKKSALKKPRRSPPQASWPPASWPVAQAPVPTPAPTTRPSPSPPAPPPHAEILTNAVADQLKEQGYARSEGVHRLHPAQHGHRGGGEVDANYFQHQPYLDSFNEEKGTHLVSVEAIHFEPFGLYAGKTASLDALTDGATVAVPNDTTNEVVLCSCCSRKA